MSNDFSWLEIRWFRDERDSPLTFKFKTSLNIIIEFESNLAKRSQDRPLINLSNVQQKWLYPLWSEYFLLFKAYTYFYGTFLSALNCFLNHNFCCPIGNKLILLTHLCYRFSSILLLSEFRIFPKKFKYFFPFPEQQKNYLKTSTLIYWKWSTYWWLVFLEQPVYVDISVLIVLFSTSVPRSVTFWEGRYAQKDSINDLNVLGQSPIRVCQKQGAERRAKEIGDTVPLKRTPVVCCVVSCEFLHLPLL